MSEWMMDDENMQSKGIFGGSYIVVDVECPFLLPRRMCS